jgi:hypothetical protein
MSDVTVRLQDLLALTDSPNENEALAAARAANATLRKLGKSWRDVRVELNAPQRTGAAERAFLDGCRAWYRMATWGFG